MTIVKIGDIVKYRNSQLPKTVVADVEYIGDRRLTRITNAQRAVDKFGAIIIEGTEETE